MPGELAPCPWCHVPPDSRTMVDGDDDNAPAGSIIVCLYCARTSVVDDAGGLRKPTIDELAQFATHPSWRSASSYARWVLTQRARWN